MNPSAYVVIALFDEVPTSAGFVIARGSAAAIVGNTLKAPIKAGSSYIFFIDMILLPVSPQDIYSKFLSATGKNAPQQQQQQQPGGVKPQTKSSGKP